MNNIAIVDVDGVVLDYNTHYPTGWKRAFGEDLELVDPDAFHAPNMWSARHLVGDELDHLKEAGMNYEYWSTMPAIPGAKRLLEDLYNQGYTTIACSALHGCWHEARMQNLQDLFGDLITALICSGDIPKHTYVNAIGAKVFIDDYAPFFYNVNSNVKKILVNRSPKCTKNPNWNFPINGFDQVVTNINQIIL